MSNSHSRTVAVRRDSLTDRMGCLKAGQVAGLMVPTPAYVRFATHYGFVPDFCHPRDPESKGMVEHLVGYAKRDVPRPEDLGDLRAWNTAAQAWCEEVNAGVHSEISAVPAERLATEATLLKPLPSLRPRIGDTAVRKVDKLSTIRLSSARYSVPHRLVGRHVETVTFDGFVEIFDPATGGLVATHHQVGPGETSIDDNHYPTPRKAPSRAPRARNRQEKAFIALGKEAEQWILGGAAAGEANIARDVIEIIDELVPAHGEDAVLAAVKRAVTFKRYTIKDIRSILNTGACGPTTAEAGHRLSVDLPATETASLDNYRIEKLQ